MKKEYVNHYAKIRLSASLESIVQMRAFI